MDSDDDIEFNDSSVRSCRFTADSCQGFANQEWLPGDNRTSTKRSFWSPALWSSRSGTVSSRSAAHCLVARSQPTHPWLCQDVSCMLKVPPNTYGANTSSATARTTAIGDWWRLVGVWGQVLPRIDWLLLGFIRVRGSKTATSEIVVTKLRKMFARFGKPDVVRSQSEIQCGSYGLKHCTRAWGLRHITPGLYHSQTT